MIDGYNHLARGVTDMHQVVRALSEGGVRVVTPATGSSVETPLL